MDRHLPSRRVKTCPKYTSFGSSWQSGRPKAVLCSRLGPLPSRDDPSWTLSAMCYDGNNDSECLPIGPVYDVSVKFRAPCISFAFLILPQVLPPLKVEGKCKREEACLGLALGSSFLLLYFFRNISALNEFHPSGQRRGGKASLKT